MNQYGWERVVLVYTENDYGEDSMTEFVRQSQQKQVCIVATIAVPATPDLNTYIDRLQNIGNYDVNGAIFFGTHEPNMMVSL